MTKRRELKGVANSLLHSFISRNNDISGYWGIGKLYLLAKENNSDHVLIDLLKRRMNPNSNDFGDLFDRYQSYFSKFVEQKDSFGWVTTPTKIEAVQIFLSFNSTSDDKLEYWARRHMGENFKCEVKIKTDLGKVYSSQIYGRCRLHDPRKERRRAIKIEDSSADSHGATVN